jgi:transposase-like protein
MAYRCKDCRKHFSVRTGTVLAESGSVPLGGVRGRARSHLA